MVKKVPLEKESTLFSFLSLTVYDVTKKAWNGPNILDCTETSKKTARYYGRDSRLLQVWAH